MVNWLTLYSKKFVWVIAALAFLASLLIISVFQNYTSEAPGPNLMPARIEIDFGNGKRRLFEGNLDGAYQLSVALDSVAAAGRFSIDKEGDKIVSIEGLGRNGEWKIYRNGLYEVLPLDELNISPGDRYTIRLEK